MILLKSIKSVLGEDKDATVEECKVLQVQETLPDLEHSHQLDEDALTTEGRKITDSPNLYRFIKYLGKGASGFVVRGQDLCGKKRHALKMIDVSLTKSKYVQSEIVNHFRLVHPHIISLEQIFVTDDHLVLVTEYADHGDLFSHIKNNNGLGEEESRWLFQQMILAVDFCHRMNIIHRDIKPENMLLSSSKDGRMILKLCDFGFSKDISNAVAHARLGTPMYMAPEVTKNVADDEYDGRQSDVWSCGVVLYVMLSGRHPSLEFALEDGATGSVGAIPGVSPECYDLLTRMLEPNPQKRATVSEVMSSRWFSAGIGKDLAMFNTRVLGRLQKFPRVTATTEDKVRIILQGSVQVPYLRQYDI